MSMISEEQELNKQFRQSLARFNQGLGRIYCAFMAEHLDEPHVAQALYAASLIFGRDSEGPQYQLESQFAQASAVISMGQAVRELDQGKASIPYVLAVVQGEALSILAEQGIVENPLAIAFGEEELPAKLPEPHHELAALAAQAAVTAESIKRLLAWPEGSVSAREEIVSLGISLGTVVQQMQWRWHAETIRRSRDAAIGLKRAVAMRREKAEEYRAGFLKQRAERCQQVVQEYLARNPEHSQEAALRYAGKEIGISVRTAKRDLALLGHPRHKK